jgi:hypothetical protein
MRTLSLSIGVILMSIKQIMLCMTGAVIAALAFQAHAGNLVADNFTNFDSTTVTNSNICSTILGQAGIARAHTVGNIISDAQVKRACGRHKHDCVAEVHMTANCKGRTVATVKFDVDTGIYEIVNHRTNPDAEPQFIVSGSGFHSTVKQE